VVTNLLPGSVVSIQHTPLTFMPSCVILVILKLREVIL
jgi:hypothetical protein